MSSLSERAQHIATSAALIACVTLAGTAWGGTEVRDGVPHVLNPAAPARAPETVTATELWRVGGEDDEDIIFGVLSSIVADGGGNLYLLDSQLNEVIVFSPDGEYLRTIGREGEGPGEFRRAGGVFLTPAGDVAVLQRMPGKIVLLTPAGEPAGLFALPEEYDGGPVFLTGGSLAGNDVILAMRQFARKETSFEVTRFLVRVSPEGKIKSTYHERTDKRDMANFVFDEKKDAQVLWVADAGGNLYTNDNFDAYRINVYGPGGSLDRVIEREYKHRTRSEQEKKDNAPRVEVRRRGGSRMEVETKVSDTDRDIQDIHIRHGDLWVLSSRGVYDAPDGVIAMFDVFDGDGRFQRQVSIRGEGDADEDGIHFVGDRMFVVRGLRSAENAMNGGDDEEADEEDAQPMAVICYDLGGIVEAGR